MRPVYGPEIAGFEPDIRLCRDPLVQQHSGTKVTQLLVAGLVDTRQIVIEQAARYTQRGLSGPVWPPLGGLAQQVLHGVAVQDVGKGLSLTGP